MLLQAGPFSGAGAHTKTIHKDGNTVMVTTVPHRPLPGPAWLYWEDLRPGAEFHFQSPGHSSSDICYIAIFLMLVAVECHKPRLHSMPKKAEFFCGQFLGNSFVRPQPLPAESRWGVRDRRSRSGRALHQYWDDGWA